MAYAMIGGIIVGTVLTLLFRGALRGVVPDRGAGRDRRREESVILNVRPRVIIATAGPFRTDASANARA